MPQDLKSRINAALYMSSNAGSMIKDLFHKELKKNEKSAHDFVTQLDKEIERMVIHSLDQQFPDDGFYGEETKPKQSKDGYEWVVDPIDGTNNFIRGLPLCGFQLAILYKGEPVYGLIHRPLTQEIYSAIKGEGAHYENQLTGEKSKINVSNRNLEDAMAIFDSKVGKSNNPSTGIFQKISDHIASVRVLGVAVFDLPAVAEGSIELLITGIANKYDIAAGQLLIEEAGGISYNIQGVQNSLTDNLVVFSNRAVKDQLLDIIS